MQRRVKFSHAFLRGTKDFQNGISLKDNPFVSDLRKRRDWDYGYLSAAKGAKSTTQPGRDGHVNLIVNVKRRHIHRNPPIKDHKTGEVDYEKELDREKERNLELINQVERKLKSGQHKGQKVLVDVVNNPPGKRYFPRAWK